MYIEQNEIWIAYYNENHLLHRLDGPALEHISGKYKGYKLWSINGKYHREDGPAIINADGSKRYWFYNQEYYYIETDEEWIGEVKKMKWKLLLK